MTKKELTDGFKNYVNKGLEKEDKKMTCSSAEATLDMVIDYLCEQLCNGEEISFQNYFKLGVRDTKPRTIKNISTGEMITVPSFKVPYIKFSKVLKDKIKNKK
jgi:nucleoid DNA-binding protein